MQRCVLTPISWAQNLNLPELEPEKDDQSWVERLELTKGTHQWGHLCSDGLPTLSRKIMATVLSGISDILLEVYGTVQRATISRTGPVSPQHPVNLAQPMINMSAKQTMLWRYSTSIHTQKCVLIVQRKEQKWRTYNHTSTMFNDVPHEPGVSIQGK